MNNRIPSFILAIVALTMSITSLAIRKDCNVGKPYIIVYENPTEEDEKRCRDDYPNCMDVLSTNDLPTREYLPKHCYDENGEFQATDECEEALHGF